MLVYIYNIEISLLLDNYKMLFDLTLNLSILLFLVLVK